MSFSEWREVKLGEIINLNYGKGLSATKRNPGNIPVYSSAGITGWHDKALIKKNGIVVGRKGTVGTVYYSETPFYCIDTAYYLTEDDTKEDLKYLYYLLNHLPLKKLNTDSAVPGLNRDNAYSQVFSLPPIQEQKSIAHILSTLDDKIEVNNQMNKTLENMAQAIFKQWFVDFEFPNEYGEPYKSSGGEMVESELGMIPKGWGVSTLKEVINIIDNRGKTPPQEPCKTNYPIIDVKALSGDIRVIDYNNCMKYVSKETYDNWFRSGHPSQGDILLSTVGSLAELKIFMGNKGCIAQNVVALRAKNISNLYLYELLKNIKNDLVSYNIGSVQPSIKVTHIVKHKILIPNDIVVEKFHLFMYEITNEIFIKHNENVLLTSMRDSLLPKLMSGEIRVPLDEEGDAS